MSSTKMQCQQVVQKSSRVAAHARIAGSKRAGGRETNDVVRCRDEWRLGSACHWMRHSSLLVPLLLADARATVMHPYSVLAATIIAISQRQDNLLPRGG